jgi:hypothetical protein
MSELELIRKEISMIRESQERLASWLTAVGALLLKLGEQETQRLKRN